MKKINLILCLLAITTIGAFAQKVNEKKVEKIYKSKGYGKYVELQGKADVMDMKRPTLIKLATSYRKTGDMINAEYAYGALIEQNDDTPDFHLHYAQALQANGKYMLAKKHYLIYDENSKDENNANGRDNRGQILASACDRIAQFVAVGDIKIRNEKAINGASLDFSPVYYKDGIVFVSTRGEQREDRMDNWINDNFMDLYYAERGEDGKLGTPKLFSNDLNTKFHEGPATFEGDEQKIYFTRNNYHMGRRGKSKDNITKLKIYSARQINDKWTDIKDLRFNSDELDVCHPTITPDGRILIFARDGEGGLGGMDLYVSFRIGNRWTAPMNMGPKINTAGNELFPYVHHDGSLFFASDGHAGLGGLDMFMSEPEGEGQEIMWNMPLNIGAPFNSQYDDFSLILNREETEGYFTSNREGGNGKDDIYHFTIKESFKAVSPKPLIPIDICVFDKSDNSRIEGATVTIRKADANMANLSEQERLSMGVLEGTNIILNLTPVRQGSNEYLIRMNQLNAPKKDVDQIYYTDDEGVFLYNMYGGQEYILEAEKDGYIVAQERFLMPKNGNLEEFCVGLQKRPSLFANSDGTNSNNDPNNPNNGSPTLVGPNGEPLVLGPDGKPLPTDQPYVVGVALNKEYNRPLSGTEVILLNRCNGEETTVILDKTGAFGFSLECGCDYVVKAKKNKFIGANQIISLRNKEDCDKPIIAEMLMTPGFDKLGNPIKIGDQTITESLKEGDVMELRNVFYDFDQYYIRDDASPDLDRVAILMLQFPSMEIELSSHTDSRGTTNYNETLSSNRAKEAKNYIMRKGIAGSRIKAIGYGESRHRNNCKDNVPCSEYEHQRNRRTEILITSFDKSEYIKVYYDNNEPTKVDPKR